MLDEYVIGVHNRQSPEADIPIIDKSSVEYRLGGAANVALNLQALDLNPMLISINGDDEHGRKLTALCKSHIKETHIIKIEGHQTTTKTRIVDPSFKQWLRIDSERIEDVSKDHLQIVLLKLKELLISSEVDAIIIQDYNKGLITVECIKAVTSLAEALKVPIFVDPKRNNFLELSESEVFKPNLKELEWAWGQAIEPSVSSLSLAISELGLKSKQIYVTLAEKGIFYLDQTSGLKGIIEGTEIEKPDVSGAGDTVMAALVFSYLNGASTKQMAQLANKAGYLVCLKKGVSTVSKTEIEAKNL